VEVKEWINNVKNVEEDHIEEYDFSLNALEESYAHHTIRIKKSYYGRDLVILIDNESMHNFIDELVI
jgi:UDP-N-acetylmuramate-alanine ligase